MTIGQQKNLEERYRERCEEVLTLRKELAESCKQVTFLLDENNRLRHRAANSTSDPSRKIPDSEFLVVIERITNARSDAEEKRKIARHVKLPVPLSISAVARELGFSDANIHKNYPHIKTLIQYYQGKSYENKIKKLYHEKSKLAAQLKAVKAERDQRYSMCEKMANHLFVAFIKENKRQLLLSNPANVLRLVPLKDQLDD